jgi:hypothetical protein
MIPRDGPSKRHAGHPPCPPERPANRGPPEEEATMAINKPTTWRNKVLECLPSSVPKDEREWIVTRLKDYTDLKMVFEKLGAGVLSNLLRFCFQIQNEKEWTAIRPSRGEGELVLQQARRARDLVKDVRTYAKYMGEDYVYVRATEQEEEKAYKSGIKAMLTMEDLTRALEEFANRLQVDRKYQAILEQAAKRAEIPIGQTIEHIHYRNRPKQGDRPNYRQWHLVGRLTDLFQSTYNTPHYGITASLFSVTFDRTISEDAIRQIVKRMTAQGAVPISIGK